MTSRSATRPELPVPAPPCETRRGIRTHRGGELRAGHAGQTVTLPGWVHRRRDHGGLIFIDLRDATGLVQVVFHPDEAPVAAALAAEVRTEYVLRVEGTVALRRAGSENPDMPTG